MRMLAQAEFEKTVRERCPPEIPVGAVELAIQRHVADQRLRDVDVADCILRAGVNAKQMAVGGRASVQRRRKRLPLDPGPGLLMEARRRVESLAEEVAALRRELLGQSRTLRSVRQAARWIEAEAARREPPSANAQAEAVRIVSDARMLLQRAGELQRAALTPLQVQARLLPYYAIKPGKRRKGSSASHEVLMPEVRHVAVVPGSSLDRLQAASAAWSRRTRLSQEGLVLHVLTGADPLLPVATVAVEDHHADYDTGRAERIQTTVIRINTKTLTFEQLRLVHRRIAAAVRGVRKGRVRSGRRIGDDEQTFREVLDELGPPSGRGASRVYWRRFAVRAAERGLRIEWSAAMYRYRRRPTLDGTP